MEASSSIISLLLATLLESLVGLSGTVLIYIAIGSASREKKELRYHQEWPLWLQEFNQQYLHIPIRVIFIDPEYVHVLPQLPFQYIKVENTHCGQLSIVQSFNPHSPSGVQRNIQVHVVPLSIDMDGSQDPFNIIALAQALEDMCATNEKIMVVIDAFSGHNLYAFRSAVDIRTPGRFLLGGEWNRDSGCFRDFSEPGTCPIIASSGPQTFMFLTPKTVDDRDHRIIMSMTPEMEPKPTFAQKSLRMWIERDCDGLRKVLVNELLFLLRMFTKVKRGVEIEDSKDIIQRSLERLGVHKISSISCSEDVHRHMRGLISEIARYYTKDVSKFEVDILITCISTEPDIYKYATIVSDFFKQHFPQYPFE